jgi:hypothetical protein
VRSFLGFYDKWGALVYTARHLRDSWSLFAAVVSDLVALNLAFLAAFFVRRLLDPIFPQPLFDLVDYWPLILSVNLASLVVLPMTGRYSSNADRSRTSHALSSIRAAFFVSLLVMSGTWLSYTRTFSRAVLLLFVPFYLAALELTGWLSGRILGGAGGERRARRAVVVGGSARFQSPDLGTGLPEQCVLAGVVNTDGGLVSSQRLLGDLGDLPVIVDRYRIEVLFVGREVAPTPRLVSMLQRFAADGVELRVDEPWNGAVAGLGCDSGSMGAWTPLGLPALLGRGAAAKVVLDRILGFVLAVVSLPGYLVSSTLGRAFGVRMRPVTIAGTQARWNELTSRTARPLPGWVQLPRFIQVLRGRLSLVGPEAPAGAGDRLLLRPGLAPPVLAGQVLDEASYCERWSLALDLECLLRQPGALLGAGRITSVSEAPARPGED